MAVPQAFAHDPSAWGGAFRTRDAGVTWLPIDAGQFIGGALALAVDPADPNHLLYATDTRLLRSRNGGRDWSQEPSTIFSGPTLAVVFGTGGNTVLAATAGGVFRKEREGTWTAVDLPAAVNPASSIVAGTQAGVFYLAGARGLYRSDDGGVTWVQLTDRLASVPTMLSVLAEPAETLFALVQGDIYTSVDRGMSWREARSALPASAIETVCAGQQAARVWAAGSDRVYRSDDGGSRWVAIGQPLPQTGTNVRGIAASEDGKTILLTTHRGLFRSTDAGASWLPGEGTLPVHLEAGPLVRDPREAQTFYAAFSLTPYKEIRRRAVEGSNLLAQVDPLSLAGGGAFLILIGILGIVVVRKLIRMSQGVPPTTPSGTR